MRHLDRWLTLPSHGLLPLGPGASPILSLLDDLFVCAVSIALPSGCIIPQYNRAQSGERWPATAARTYARWDDITKAGETSVPGRNFDLPPSYEGEHYFCVGWYSQTAGQGLAAPFPADMLLIEPLHAYE